VKAGKAKLALRVETLRSLTGGALVGVRGGIVSGDNVVPTRSPQCIQSCVPGCTRDDKQTLLCPPTFTKETLR
jgi:hypothetical protein